MTSIKRVTSITIFFLSALYSHAQERDSLDVKIGQMILIGVPGTSVDPTVLKEIKDGKAGSIIFFEKNIAKKNSFQQLKNMAWAYNAVAPIPLFISIDQEGGKVNRLKEKYGFPRSISAAAMSSSIDSVRYYGHSTAATMASLGINVNFAPVVDLATNPNNPVIAKAERAFSPNVDTVTSFAREFVITHRRVGVISVLKHFPGHGSSMDDTHFGIADVTKTWEQKEVLPYKQLIASGYVDAVMTAHIVNEKLDGRGLPGTLSDRIIDSLLRRELKFDGVVFSDDMQMHAITEHYGLEEAIKLAVNAGVDILTFSNNIQGSEDRTVDKVHSIIRNFVMDGTIPKERIEQSYRRIIALKSRLGSSEADYYRNEWLKSKSELEEYKLKLKTVEKQKMQATKKDSVSQESSETDKPKRKKKKKRSGPL